MLRLRLSAFLAMVIFCLTATSEANRYLYDSNKKYLGRIAPDMKIYNKRNKHVGNVLSNGKMVALNGDFIGRAVDEAKKYVDPGYSFRIDAKGNLYNEQDEKIADIFFDGDVHFSDVKEINLFGFCVLKEDGNIYDKNTGKLVFDSVYSKRFVKFWDAIEESKKVAKGIIKVTNDGRLVNYLGKKVGYAKGLEIFDLSDKLIARINAYGFVMLTNGAMANDVDVSEYLNR